VDENQPSWPAGNSDAEADVKDLLGLFDVPAFARRGQDLEFAVRRLHDRCRAARESMLDMVRMRLGQWSTAVTGPAAWKLVFARSIEPLWTLSGAKPPHWANQAAPIRRQKLIAGHLQSSVLRFNRRWTQYLGRLNLDPTNQLIDQYNRYYVLEKECAMGSPRLALRHFSPVPLLTTESLLHDHPCLPVPERLVPPGRHDR
jgi:hypothetical protein